MGKKNPAAGPDPPTTPPGEPSGPTKPVRVYEMVHEWIYWIKEVTGEDQAEIVDPWIRTPAYLRYLELLPDIERLKERRRQEAERKAGNKPS